MTDQEQANDVESALSEMRACTICGEPYHDHDLCLLDYPHLAFCVTCYQVKKDKLSFWADLRSKLG